MTKEERNLLMIDLTSRLLYGVKVETYWKFEDKKNKTFPVETLTYDMLGYYVGDDEWYFRMHYRPFLRPMSSMTEDEREELFQIWKLGKENGSESVTKLLKEIFYKAINENYILKLATSFENWIDVMAWFNKKHFDYRGLIEKELAVKATEEMYK